MSVHFRRTIPLVRLVFAVYASAQVPGARQPDLQKIEIDMTHAVPLPGLPATGAFAYPFSCSSDGDVYAGELVLDEQGRPVSTIPDLYKVSPQAIVKHIPKPIPTATYKQLDSPSFFAGGGTLVTLIRAAKPTGQDGQIRPGSDFFLSITDSNGDHPKLIRLELDFNPVKVAVFGSGEFVVLGSDRKTFDPVVASLTSEGQFKKYLDVFPKVEDAEKYSVSENTRIHDLTLSVGAAQFASWGADILMAAPGIDPSSVYHFRATGEVQQIRIKLPVDQRLAGILGSGAKDSWVVRGQSAASAKQMARTHITENPEELLYEVNPSNGELIRRIDVSGPLPGEIACAADGKLSAIYLGDPKPGASDQLVLASARR